jgi:hypothetical protein
MLRIACVKEDKYRKVRADARQRLNPCQSRVA